MALWQRVCCSRRGCCRWKPKIKFIGIQNWNIKRTYVRKSNTLWSVGEQWYWARNEPRKQLHVPHCIEELRLHWINLCSPFRVSNEWRSSTIVVQTSFYHWLGHLELPSIGHELFRRIFGQSLGLDLSQLSCERVLRRPNHVQRCKSKIWALATHRTHQNYICPLRLSSGMFGRANPTPRSFSNSEFSQFIHI